MARLKSIELHVKYLNSVAELLYVEKRSDTKSTGVFIAVVSLTVEEGGSHSYKKVKEGNPGNHDVGDICGKAISE